MLKNKKASQPLWETLIFFILNIIFFCALLFFVLRSASGDAIVEENYAKTIALTIDSMKPNSEVWLSLNMLYEVSDKNKFDRNQVISFDLKNHVVNVKVSKSSGYTFHYFSELKEINKQEGGTILVLKT